MFATIENRDGRRDVAYHLSEDAAKRRDPLVGAIPNGTRVEPLRRSTSPQGHAKVRYGNADVYVRQVHINEAETNGGAANGSLTFTTPLTWVMLEHCAGQPSVAYHITKDAAQRNEPHHGTIPNGTQVQLVECASHIVDFAKVRYGCTDVFVRQVNIKRDLQVHSASNESRNASSKVVALRHCNGKQDIVFHSTLQAARQREIPHGKLASGCQVEVLVSPQGAQGWAQVRWRNNDVWINGSHLMKAAL